MQYLLSNVLWVVNHDGFKNLTLISSKEKDKVVSKKYEETFDKSKTFY